MAERGPDQLDRVADLATRAAAGSRGGAAGMARCCSLQSARRAARRLERSPRRRNMAGREVDLAMLKRAPIRARYAGHQPGQPMAQPAVSALLHPVGRHACSFLAAVAQVPGPASVDPSCCCRCPGPGEYPGLSLTQARSGQDVQSSPATPSGAGEELRASKHLSSGSSIKAAGHSKFNQKSAHFSVCLGASNAAYIPTISVPLANTDITSSIGSRCTFLRVLSPMALP